MPDGAATAHLYKPKFITLLKEGLKLEQLRSDAFAGLTVAVVALPLSMAIAVASGVSPERGLYTAIVGGFLVSLLGGSRFQVGGPAGAFIVLVAATGAQFGLQGLFAAVLLSGAMLVLLGLTRLGSLVRHVPHAVVVSFTCAIAVTILASQLKDLAGLKLAGVEPGPLFPKLAALARVLPSFDASTLAVGGGTAIVVFAIKRLTPRWPAMLIGVVGATVLAALLHLPAETVHDRFGAIPRGLPLPALPAFDWRRIADIAPAAFSFTLLGAVESLLSAKVADAMTGRKHRSNMELVAQGVANLASPLFGGICVTGTIARTAANIRAGARSPLAGMLHALFLLLFMAAAGPLVGFVPLAALAGVLVVVAWDMAEKVEFARLLRDWRSAAVLLTTFGLTLARDLTAGIVAGCCVAAILALAKRPVAEEGA
jgi:SulP family sulfate permease